MNAAFPASTTTLSERERVCVSETLPQLRATDLKIRTTDQVLPSYFSKYYCKGRFRTGRYSASLPQLKVFLNWFWVFLISKVSWNKTHSGRLDQGQTDRQTHEGRRSDMELQRGRSFLHRCAGSGDVVHAGLVVTLLIGKSLVVFPYYPTLVPLSSRLIFSPPSYAFQMGQLPKCCSFCMACPTRDFLNKLG